MMFKVCVALTLVASALIQDSCGFCQTEGQTCNVMNGKTCCNGLMCESGIGNTRICKRSAGSGAGCRLRNEECKINAIDVMKCCGSLRCMPAYMNKMMCQ